jgi:hypothetical protein
MKDKRKLSLSRMLKDIIFMVPSLFFSVTNLTAIISAEAELAIKSLIILIILCFLTAALITAAWLCLLAMLFMWLLSLQISFVVSFLILFACNVVILGIVFYVISRYRKNLSFPVSTSVIKRFVR